MAGPLDGIRVVDFSRVLAGPHCTQTLLDLGAEVIKIEPPRGDLSRQAFPRRGTVSGYYAQQNAGKRNLSIDLNRPGTREVVLDLVDRADVVVENFRPGTLGWFGLDYETVAARNPRLVYVSMSGYGQHGSWRSRSAYAPTVEAESGLTMITAEHFSSDPDSMQTDSLSHADVYTGLHGAIAVLAALHRRETTGRGEHVDVAMAAVLLSINERVHADLGDEEIGDEVPVLGATDAPFFVGPDGRRFVSPMSLVGSMSFPLYLAAMRRADLADDPRFRTPTDRRRNLAELHRIIQDWIWTFDDLESLNAQLDEAKIASGTLRTTSELAATDWAKEWGVTSTVSDRAGGTYTVPGQPWHFSGGRAETTGRLPARQGEHNFEVLHELGYPQDRIDALAASGALVEVRDDLTATSDPPDREDGPDPSAPMARDAVQEGNADPTTGTVLPTIATQADLQPPHERSHHVR